MAGTHENNWEERGKPTGECGQMLMTNPRRLALNSTPPVTFDSVRLEIDDDNCEARIPPVLRSTIKSCPKCRIVSRMKNGLYIDEVEMIP